MQGEQKTATAARAISRQRPFTSQAGIIAIDTVGRRGGRAGPLQELCTGAGTIADTSQTRGLPRERLVQRWRAGLAKR